MADRMRPGREMEALVAEHVMGWTWKRDQAFYVVGFDRDDQPVREPHCEPWRFIVAPDSMYAEMAAARGDERIDMSHHLPVPRYSTDIGAAWQVIGTLHGNTEKWYRFHKALTLDVLPSFGATGLHELESSVAAWAICLAATAPEGR